MRAEQLIRRMPESALAAALAEEFGLEADPIPAAALARKLVSPDYIRKSLAHMKPWEKDTLLQIVKEFACLPFEQDRLEAAASFLSGAHIRAGLIRLRRRGILFALRKSWGEYVYVLPEDVLDCLCSFLFPGGFEPWIPASAEETVEGGEQRWGLAYDVFQLLVYVSKNEVTAAQKGNLHKRHVDKLTGLFTLKDADFEEMELSYTHSDAYGPAFAVVLDMALLFGLVRFEDRRLLAVPEAVSGWFAKPIEVVQEELLSAWLDISRPSSGWQIVLLFKLCTMKPCEWHHLEHLFDWAVGYGIMDKTDRPCAAVFFQTMVHLFEAIGWLESGTASNGQQLFKQRAFSRDEGETPARDAGSGFYVQADYEIIVPPGASFALLWELEAMGERVRNDGLSVYRLTKESVRYALENGRDAESCITFLETYAYYGVPDHVKAAVREWAGQYGTVTVSQLLVITCKDGETADLIGRLPECRPYLGERLGEKHYVVLSGQAEPFILLLERMGLSPRNAVSEAGSNREGARNAFPVLSAGTPPEFPTNETSKASQNRIFYPGASDLPYPPAPMLPSSEELVPDLQSIPPMWLKEFRPYHASTQKDMIRKAIEWRTLLRIKSEGKEWEVIPRKLQEGRETWELIGMRNAEPVSLEAGQWEEMKLILPGINDES